MKRQQGWTVWGLFSVMALLVFFAYIGMKLFPHYFDNLKLQEALEQVLDDPRVLGMDRRQIVGELDNILYIDYGHQIVNLKEELAVQKDRQSLVLSVDYEVTEHLFYNVSALMDFQAMAERPLR